MTTRTGTISVNTTDIFPIIKKWLYSEHDIFLRELVSNACDAITKRAAIGRTQNASTPNGQVTIEVDKEKGTIKIIDNGVGMTEEEVEKYIAQLAFSGAEEFIKKMEDIKKTDSKDEIIGKFGLGFYSSFMVAEKVEIDSLSMQEGAKPTKWTCNGETEYSFSESQRKDVGTEITLTINEESKEFLETYFTRKTLSHYCDFMPYPIELVDVNQRTKTFEENLKAEKEEDKKPIEVDIINNTQPLWKKDPSNISDEEYKNFYSKLFPMDPEPLFWLHLNIDHPFTLQGILYFPKLNPNKPISEQNIRLYCKQVFVSDNVKNVIPEFLSMLKGAIDSSDIPLNVSRSALQGDPNIKKIANYIVKKVAESLKKLSKNEREKYESIWEDISLFVKYGVVSESKFDEIMRDHLLFKTNEGKLVTLLEYKELIPEEYKEKLANKVIYFEKDASDFGLVQQLWENKVPAVETDNNLDPHLTQHIEFQKKGDNEYKFVSVDSEFENIIGEGEASANDIKIKEFFESTLKDKEDENLEIEVKNLKNNFSPAYFKVDQNMKRFQQMTKTMGQSAFNMPLKRTLVVNPNHSLIKNAFHLWEKEDKKEIAKKIVKHVEDLASISTESLDMNAKKNFVQRSQDIMEELSRIALS
ncbi:MAG: molecular chaperone HtpG [Halobacteriovoraceae bacterium]|nr:molecular chaperone HtpG [Halobacteriovoraceae bacterium]MCB9095597.1 molecular chaperone HtpG [Halobacteriovoraceae bacterium]